MIEVAQWSTKNSQNSNAAAVKRNRISHSSSNPISREGNRGESGFLLLSLSALTVWRTLHNVSLFTVSHEKRKNPCFLLGRESWKEALMNTSRLSQMRSSMFEVNHTRSVYYEASSTKPLIQLHGTPLELPTAKRGIAHFPPQKGSLCFLWVVQVVQWLLWITEVCVAVKEKHDY